MANATSSTAREGSRGTRCIAIVGPFLSGKTTLLEAILDRTGAIPRPGRVAEGSTVGDASPEARAHGLSVEANFATTTFMGETFAFVDLPGSIEFQADAGAILPACDAAIVVCEPDVKRVPALQVTLKSLTQQRIPHLIFLNKMDTTTMRVRDIVPLLQPASEVPLVLRQIPIWDGDVATGYVDLASERAYFYRDGAPSEMIPMPSTVKARENEARFHMLEQLADHDDALMEQLLSDVTPARDRIFDDLAREMRDGLICPVFLGSALKGNGILRLLKALRHEAPTIAETAARLGLVKVPSAIHVMKTLHQPHAGKLSIVRLLSGSLRDGEDVSHASHAERAAGLAVLLGASVKKQPSAAAGDVVAINRLEAAKTGSLLSTGSGTAPATIPRLEIAPPVHGVAIELREKKDEVKLSAALARLMEEDPGLLLEHATGTHELILWGQGEMHLRVTLERLKRKYAVDATHRPRHIPYQETIRSGIEIRGRHKKQSGGHGQFGDVLIEIRPLPRGGGIRFDEKIHGGTVPKQYIPSVEIGVRDYLACGPLGFPVVDIAVTLLDGSAHSVDSSDMAFRQAGRLAMSEGMPKCNPVLLEPVMSVAIITPSDATARINTIVTQRRGQLLGFNSREGWHGWDVVSAQIPESELSGLIVDIRSATAGVGSYTARFDHLQELTGRLADEAIKATRQV